MSRKPPPSKESIVNYWKNNTDKDELLDVEWKCEDLPFINYYCKSCKCAEKTCWSCGDKYEKDNKDEEDKKTKIFRSHIIPHALGGSNEPSNYVLLCKQCDLENPEVNSRELYLHWLKSRKNVCIFGFTDTYWIGRTVIEYKNLYGTFFIDDLKNIFIELTKLSINLDEEETFLKQFSKENFISNNAIKHNPSSKACLMRLYILNKMQYIETKKLEILSKKSENIIKKKITIIIDT